MGLAQLLMADPATADIGSGWFRLECCGLKRLLRLAAGPEQLARGAVTPALHSFVGPGRWRAAEDDSQEKQ